MSHRNGRRRTGLGLESLEGRLAPSGGLVEHPGGHHAHAEVHKQQRAGDDAAHQHKGAKAQAAHVAGADDPATHDVGDDHGVNARHGGRDDGPAHK